MAVKPLRELAQRACIRCVKSITDVGDIPFDLLRPILMRVESPEHLALLESRSPQLQGADAEIWKEFIKRDIPDWEKRPHEPRDPKNWSKVYRKLKRDAEKEMLQSASKLKKAFDSIKEEKEQNVAQIVQRAKLPVRRPTGRQIIGARTYGIPSQIKRPVSKGISESKMTVPTHELKNRTTKILQAPPNFVADRKRLAVAHNVQTQPQPQIRTAPVSARPSTRPIDTKLTTDTSLQDREARLRALTQRPSSQSVRNSALSSHLGPAPMSPRKRGSDALEDQDPHLSSKRNPIDGDRTHTRSISSPRAFSSTLQALGSSPREIRHGPDIVTVRSRPSE